MSNPLAQMGRLNQEGIPTPWRDNTICIRSQFAASAPDKLRVVEAAGWSFESKIRIDCVMETI